MSGDGHIGVESAVDISVCMYVYIYMCVCVYTAKSGGLLTNEMEWDGMMSPSKSDVPKIT